MTIADVSDLIEFVYGLMRDLVKAPSDRVFNRLNPDGSPIRPLLWHYTSGQNLINILREGEIWTTQVACLNDSTEILHAAKVFREALSEALKRIELKALDATAEPDPAYFLCKAAIKSREIKPRTALGSLGAYTRIDHDEHEAHFSNRWMELHGNRHLGSMELCMDTFHREYNDVWPDLMEKLEKWIEANDAQLEVTKDDPTNGR